MGNVHVLHHRFPALATAAFASLALTFVAIAGTTCSFLSVEANDGRFIEFTSNVEQEAVTSSSFGVLCDTYYFDSEGDTMWTISKIFLYVSLALGGMAVLLSWAITWCIPPTKWTWKLLSVVSALTAVLNIPIFLLFESEPCTIDSSRQKCVLSFGSFLLMSGTISSIAVVLLTQCIDPPTWGKELDAWKVRKRGEGSRAVVLSDEYPESDKRDPENPSPNEASPPHDDDDEIRAAAMGGIFGGLQRWTDRQRWARSSDLRQVDTSPSSNDDEEALPFAGAGSYYANSSNSRLLLKVSPEGRRPDDEQSSVMSFGDLDDYVKMVEEEKKQNGSVSIASLNEFMENESVPTEPRSDAAVLVLPEDVSEPKALSTATTDGQEKYKEEPQFYSEMKPPPSTDDGKGLLAKDDGDTAEEVDTNRESKISRGIRSLTNRVIRDTNRRSKSGKMYSTLDDDDEESGVYSAPTTFSNKAGDAETVTDDDESSGKVRSPSDTDHLHHQTLLFDWNALHAAANAGIILSQEPQSDSDSSDEDEPAHISYTSDDTFGPGSQSSLGNCPDIEDNNSSFSGSSISDISDKDDDDDHDLVLGAGVTTKSRKERRRSPRKSPRKLRRGHSSANSVSSHTSVLDLTIDEETDMDLKEFESSDDEQNKIHEGGYKSAPETVGGNRKLSPYAFVQSESLPISGERGYIIPKSEQVDVSSTKSSEDYSKLRDLVTPDTSTNRLSPVSLVELVNGVNGPALHLDGSSIEGQEPAGYESSAGNGGESIVGTDDEEDSHPRSRRCRSMSIPRRKKNSIVHPLVSPPTSPESLVDGNLPWREERLYKGGIHSTSSHIISVSDSETSSELCMSEMSAKTSMSRRARKARIRRLQSESDTHRQRSRTLDPPKTRRRYDRQSTYDVPESHTVAMNRLLLGSDHGAEEASL